jgi:hypothetical protein
MRLETLHQHFLEIVNIARFQSPCNYALLFKDGKAGTRVLLKISTLR